MNHPITHTIKTLLTAAPAAILVFTSIAQAQNTMSSSNEVIIDWLLNGFFLSLLVLIVLFHQTTRILAKGAKPEIKLKFGRYAGAMAMLFDGMLQDKFIKQRDRMRTYVRLTALTSVLLFLSLFLFKS